MGKEAPEVICMDCSVERSGSDNSAPVASGTYCEHWLPEHWEAMGFKRNWGDASVMNWPTMEILRQEERTPRGTVVRFVILAPHALRRPLVIEASAGPEAHLTAWGIY